MFKDDELLALSGIQHFAYCKRQWALIHLEKQWVGNLATTQGKQLHEKVDDPTFFESRGGLLTTRSVPISSYILGIYGVADMVEFHSSNTKGVKLSGHDGLWTPIPIEYKRGKPKTDIFDEVQLCAQAICLEEMLNTSVGYGFIYYGEIRRRTKVSFTDNLRAEVVSLIEQMHANFEGKITPVEKPDKNCKSCSLSDICVPKIGKKYKTVRNYINNFLRKE